MEFKIERYVQPRGKLWTQFEISPIDVGNDLDHILEGNLSGDISFDLFEPNFPYVRVTFSGSLTMTTDDGDYVLNGDIPILYARFPKKNPISCNTYDVFALSGSPHPHAYSLSDHGVYLVFGSVPENVSRIHLQVCAQDALEKFPPFIARHGSPAESGFYTQETVSRAFAKLCGIRDAFTRVEDHNLIYLK